MNKEFRGAGRGSDSLSSKSPASAELSSGLADPSTFGPLFRFLHSKRGPYVLVVLAVIYGVGLAWYRGGWNFPVDFELYWLAAKHWSDPYTPLLIHSAEVQALFPGADLSGARLPYYYPPPAMLLSWPLSLLPMQAAFRLFCGATCAFAMVLAVRRVRWTAVLLFLSLPMFYGAFLGQIGLLIGCIAILAFEIIDTRPQLAGALLAAMVCIKPQSALVAPFVLWGRWETVRAGVVVGVSLLLASLVFGPERWVEWWQSMGRFQAEIWPIVPKIMPYLLFGHPIWWRITLIAVGVAFAAWERGLAGFLVGTLVCTPYFQLYDLLGFSFLGLLIVGDWKRMGPLKGLLPGAFGLVLIVCPAMSESLTLLIAGLIGLRLMRRRVAVARSIEFCPPREWPRALAAPIGGLH
jgi:hypothetical protein